METYYSLIGWAIVIIAAVATALFYKYWPRGKNYPSSITANHEALTTGFIVQVQACRSNEELQPIQELIEQHYEDMLGKIHHPALIQWITGMDRLIRLQQYKIKTAK